MDDLSKETHIPRKDVKKPAKALLASFGNLKGILDAPLEELRTISGSGPYLKALADKGIPAFCPRARAYFDHEEIRYLVACYAILLGYYGEGRGELAGHGLRELASVSLLSQLLPSAL